MYVAPSLHRKVKTYLAGTDNNHPACSQILDNVNERYRLKLIVNMKTLTIINFENSFT